MNGEKSSLRKKLLIKRKNFLVKNLPLTLEKLLI